MVVLQIELGGRRVGAVSEQAQLLARPLLDELADALLCLRYARGNLGVPHRRAWHRSACVATTRVERGSDGLRRALSTTPTAQSHLGQIVSDTPTPHATG